MKRKDFKLLCPCGEQINLYMVEYGQDTIVDERYCNGISCSYYGCPHAEDPEAICYSGVDKVNVARKFFRVTCPKCEFSREQVLQEDVTEA